MKLKTVSVKTDEFQKDHGEGDDGRPIVFTISAEVFEVELDFCIWPYLTTLQCGWWGCWLGFRPTPNRALALFEDTFGILTQIAISDVSKCGTVVKGAFRASPYDDDFIQDDLPF